MNSALCVSLWMSLVPQPAADRGWSDDFSSYAEGSSGAPRWHPVRGEWKLRGGRLVHAPGGEGLLIAADTGITGSMRLESRFRCVAGIPGGGVVFGLRDARRAGGCHLVRVDPEGLYFGSLDSAGEFRGEGPVPAYVEGGAWIDLVVITDAGAGTYRVVMNGKVAAEGLPLEHAGPAAGLAASWGEHEFARFAAAPAPEAPRGGVPASRPIDIAASKDGLIAVLDRVEPPVRLFTGAGMVPRGSFGKIQEGDRPIAIELGPAGDVFVLDEESGRIDRYGADAAKPEGSPPRSIVASPPIEGARGLAVLPDGRIAVAETAAGRVAVLSSTGERLTEVGRKGGGPGEHEAPADVAVDERGRLLVADFKGCRVQAFAPGGDGWKLVARSPWMAPPSRIASLAGGGVAVLGRFAYYETGGAVRYLDADLMPVGFTGAFAAGNLSEEGGLAAVGPTVLCLSRKDARVYAFLAGRGEAAVKPEFVRAQGRTEVRWQPLRALERQSGPPRLQLRKEGEGDWKDTGNVLDGLDPGGVYELRFRPHHDFHSLAPGDEGWSRPYRLLGPEPPGKRRLLDLSVLCVVYLSHEDAGSKKVTTLERSRLGSKLEGEFEVARRFFARSSRLRLNVHGDFEVIEGARALVHGGWIDPSQARRDAAPLLAAKGKRLEDYDSVIAMWAEPGWRADMPDDPGTVGGGGLTSFGYSTFGIGGRAAWLFCHEYHHQIDAFFNRSGHLEYPLNHPDATVQPGRYGQHWDSCAPPVRRP